MATVRRLPRRSEKRSRDELGLTVSIGVSFNKIFAKLGSDMKKPDAVTTLPRDDWKGRIWPLPVSGFCTSDLQRRAS